MNNLKNILIGLWVNVKSYMGQAAAFVTNHSEAVSSLLSRTKANDCLRRTRNAYQALTCYPVKDLVTPHALDSLVRNSRSYSELCENIEKSGARGDELYCYLLLFAIAEVYRSSTPPVIEGSFSPKLLK